MCIENKTNTFQDIYIKKACNKDNKCHIYNVYMLRLLTSVVKSSLARLIQTGVYYRGGAEQQGSNQEGAESSVKVSHETERASQTVLDSLCDISSPLLQTIRGQRQRKT